MFKRVLASLLVLMTLISYLPPKVSAEGTQPQGDTTEVSATEPTEPTAVPTESTEPTAVPTESTEPTAVPTESTEPTAVPTEPTEPTAVPTEPTAAMEETTTQPAVPAEEASSSETELETDGAVASGSCGDNLTWSIDAEGTLTISGTGAMWDYETPEDGSGHTLLAPWYSYSPTKLVLSEGITYIGNSAFWMCFFEGSLVLPQSLTSIGCAAFGNCAGFTGS